MDAKVLRSALQPPPSPGRGPFRAKCGAGFTPWLFLLPALVLLAIWVYWPLVRTFFLSFYSWNMLPTTDPQFCGLDNFVKLLKTPGFTDAVRNTLIMMVGILPFSVVLPMAAAILPRPSPSGPAASSGR